MLRVLDNLDETAVERRAPLGDQVRKYLPPKKIQSFTACLISALYPTLFPLPFSSSMEGSRPIPAAVPSLVVFSGGGAAGAGSPP
jgi:hypothetical protein